MIVQMGNNGPLYSDDMEAMRKATSEVGQLFLINDHAPVSWIDESNHALAEAARDWPHTTLIDWKPVAAAHEDLLWDGIHLTPGGAGLYARLVSAAVHEKVAFPPPAAATPGRPPASARALEGAGNADDDVVDAGDDAVGAVDRADRDGRGAAGQFAGGFVGRFGDEGAADVGEQLGLALFRAAGDVDRPQPQRVGFVDAHQRL